MTAPGSSRGTTPRTPTPRAETLVRVAFYGLGLLGLLVLVLELQQEVLPGSIATRIGRNSEAVLFALLVAAAVDAVPRGRRTPRTRAALGAAALVLVAAGLLLAEASSLPGTVVTLNESLVGAGLVCAYLVPDRPWRLGPWVIAPALLLVVVFFDTALVLDQAESIVPFLLAPVALDVVERGVVAPEEPERPRGRAAWMAALVVVLLAAMALAPWARESLDDPLTLGIDYVQRAAEACWGWLLLHAYFLLLARARDR